MMPCKKSTKIDTCWNEANYTNLHFQLTALHNECKNHNCLIHRGLSQPIQSCPDCVAIHVIHSNHVLRHALSVSRHRVGSHQLSSSQLDARGSHCYIQLVRLRRKGRPICSETANVRRAVCKPYCSPWRTRNDNKQTTTCSILRLAFNSHWVRILERLRIHNLT